MTLAAAPAQAEPADIVRVAGTTRYGTAAEAATQAYPTGATNVVLASGEKFPDALAGGGLAGSLDAPILLATQNSVPAETAAALQELGADNVTILGGTEAISAAVEAGLEAAGLTVDRVGGEDRFETAAMIAEELGGDTAVLANGLNFPDALAISPGTHKLELPLLLTAGTTLQEDAAAFLGQDTVTDVIIVGGTAVVPQSVEDALEADGKTVTRLAGATRYETSVEIAEFHTTVGFTLDELVLATGEKFPDALAGGPFASQKNAPMVLTQTNTLTPATEAFIEENAAEIDTIYVLGGTAAVSDAVATAAAAAADEDADGNQSFVVSGAQQQNTFGATGTRTCTVAVPAGTVVDLALVPSEDVRVTDNTVTFVDADEDEIYPLPAVEPEIVAVNGAPVGPADQIANVTSGGTIAVTFGDVDGTTADDVQLLVFTDPTAGVGQFDLTNATPNNALPKAPAEAFGVGCRTLFGPAEANIGTENTTVASINRDLDYITDADETFFYDSNDVFQYQGIALTLAQFEGIISDPDNADSLTITYNPDAAGTSTFNVTTDLVGAPTGVTATVLNADGGATINDVRVSFTPDADNGPGTVFDVVADTTNDGAITAADTVLANNVSCTPNATTGACTLTFNNLPNGTYDILVRAENAATGQVSTLGNSADVTVPGTADTAAPLAIDSVITTVSGLAGTFDTGDVFKIVFNDEMAAPTAGDTIRVRDNDATATIADFINGTNATFTLNAASETVNGAVVTAGRVLTVTVTAAPTTVQAGSTAGLQVPGTIVDQSGNTDDAGNAWVVSAANQDLLIDLDADDADSDSTV